MKLNRQLKWSWQSALHMELPAKRPKNYNVIQCVNCEWTWAWNRPRYSRKVGQHQQMSSNVNVDGQHWSTLCSTAAHSPTFWKRVGTSTVVAQFRDSSAVRPQKTQRSYCKSSGTWDFGNALSLATVLVLSVLVPGRKQLLGCAVAL